MKNMQTKALVEGAIFAGVTAILGIMYYYMQYLGILAMVWPVPVIIVGYRNGIKASILSALSAGLIVSLVTQPLVGVGLLAGFGLPGVLMGFMIKKKINPHTIILLCGLVLSVTMVVELVISLKAVGVSIPDFIAGIESSFNQQIEMTMDIYKKFAASEKDLQLMKDNLEQAAGVMRLIFPSSLVLSGLIFAFIDYKLTRIILKRVGHTIPEIVKFSMWRPAGTYSFILLGLVIFAVAVPYLKISELTVAALNVNTFLMMVFTVIGMSVVVYFIGVYGDRSGIPRALRRVIVIIAILLFMRIIALVGVLDLAFNFRKIGPERSGGGI